MGSRLALVIGAGPGIGQAVSRRFGTEGYRIVLGSRRPERMARVAESLADDGIEVVPLDVDLDDLTGLRETLEYAADQWGDPEVLVYNAALSPAVRPTNADPTTLFDGFRVNVIGALVCAQAVADAMRGHGCGTILFTGDTHVLVPRPEAVVVGMGKAALRNATFALARELEPAGIHVATVTVAGTVAPGTPFDPRYVAEEFWRVHCEPAGEWNTEVVFHGHLGERRPEVEPGLLN